MGEIKTAYFIDDEQEYMFAGTNLKEVLEFIEPYIAELNEDGSTITLTISTKQMTQAEIEAIPEI